MNRTVVINVVGLTDSLIGEHTPRIAQFAEAGSRARIAPAFPAVTCTAQSDYLTGKTATDHGIVANGWYSRELAETHFWKQPDQIVQAPKIWDALKRENSDFTCAKLFWWYNMYSKVDWSITPRPMYPADGSKHFDIYSWPYSIREEIKRDLGKFPFAGFWGPAAGVDSPQGKADCVSQWIANSAKWIEERHQPTLSLVYLPHLDYNLQRLGPKNPAISRDLGEIDAIVGNLIDFFGKRSVNVVLLSEYSITPVDTPIHLNRIFRDKGWLSVKEELGRELLDFGACKAFAVADHQIAHVYVNDPLVEENVRALLEDTPGIDRILGPEEKRAAGIDHERAGDLIAVSKENAWFTYYYWQDDKRAPDFARCVDIHRKPGYDPVELFLDPKRPLVKGQIAWRLMKKKIGMRMLMDVIPLDATLVKGSHGAHPANAEDYPVIIAQDKKLLSGAELRSQDVFGILKRAVSPS
jgi:predicted AlkP superfamily pyrophosphatase or phosphodiesterase